jgi:hypothetical protein
MPEIRIDRIIRLPINVSIEDCKEMLILLIAIWNDKTIMVKSAPMKPGAKFSPLPFGSARANALLLWLFKRFFLFVFYCFKKLR